MTVTAAETERILETLVAVGTRLLEPPLNDPMAQVEYVRLFLAPGGAPCPPWQSVHAGGETIRDSPTLMGTAHHSALSWFRRFGFEPAFSSEPADHVGLLLLFYAHLIRSGAAETDLHRFETEHLDWIPAFAANLEHHARVEPYRIIARTLCQTFGQRPERQAAD